MYPIHVHVHVKPECIDQFKIATIENAQNSLGEPGVERFDVLQQKDDPTKFLLIEVYLDENAPAKHKETAHYKNWRSIVEDMMASPRESVKYTDVFFKR